MARKKIQDITPGDRRTIRNIILESKQNVPPKAEDDFDKPLTPPVKRRTQRSSRVSRIVMWVLAIVSVALVVVAVISIFDGAKLIVTPKIEKVSADTEFVAKREKTTPDDLQFSIIRVSSTSTKSVAASGEERVEKKASGTIIIYNNYTSTPQRLIANTRFETPDGLIYRIKDAVSVPGFQKSGTETTPGSLRVTVFADETGEKYNIGLSDFTIPGLQGSDRYDKMYARSETPMQGGFSGNQKIVKDEDLKSAQDELSGVLRERLLENAKTRVPDEFYLFDTAVFYEFDEPTRTGGDGNSALVSLRGTLYGVMLNRADLSAFLARRLIDLPKQDRVSIQSLQNIKFAVKDADKFKPEESPSITWSVRGDITFVWGFDEDRLKKELSGEPRSRTDLILAKHTGISQAKAIIRPIWKRSFPKDWRDIKIEIKESE